MESGGMNPRVTVIAGEATSSHHVVPRTENPTQVTATPPPPPVAVSLQPGVGSVGTSEKKKRGRPRKYGHDGNLNMAFSPMPISSSSAPRANVNFQPMNVAAGAQSTASSKRKQKRRVGTQNLDDWISCSTGGSFTPHIITVNPGEDIAMKIITFSQSGPRAVCVISAFGAVSNVTLQQPNSSGGTFSFEGHFNILSLSGSFEHAEVSVGGRCGGLTISLSGADGRVLGGMIAGLLIASSPVQVVVGSFVPNDKSNTKRKKQKAANKVTGDATTSTAIPHVELTNPHSTQDPNISVAQNQNVSSSSTPQNQSWGMMPTGHDPRKSTTDINISWKGE